MSNNKSKPCGLNHDQILLPLTNQESSGVVSRDSSPLGPKQEHPTLLLTADQSCSDQLSIKLGTTVHFGSDAADF